MAGTIHEWFGFRPEDTSQLAADAASQEICPFMPGPCKKRSSGGVCAITPSESKVPVIVCPTRHYYGGHQFLKDIAANAFGSLSPHLGEDGLPNLVAGSAARQAAAETGSVQIGVLGQGWDSEVKLPPSMDGGAAYSVDFTLIAVSPESDLLGFVPVEVQTIDTTNNYRESVAQLRANRVVVPSKVGLNWENVSKRILPQLIVKGLMLQGERLCTHGIYFVTPEPVFNKIAMRLGGMERLREIPQQPGSITFMQYGYDSQAEITNGLPAILENTRMTTISTSDMSIAFISPQNLPRAGSYETKLRSKLKMR